MLQPITNHLTKQVLGKPADWDAAKHGECIGLPVLQFRGTFYSWWQVPFRQRIRILFGAPIQLEVMGATHPPVALNVGVLK